MTELERALVVLGSELEHPETPDLLPAVLRRLPARRRPGSTRRVVLAVGFVLLALLAAALAIPDARSALFRVLHIGGEEIRPVDELPQVKAPPRLATTLGAEVSLARARREAGFQLRELPEKPDRVYLGRRGTVWLLYGTPERVQLLVAQTPLESVNRVFFEKLTAAGTRVEEVSVDGAEGAFLSGRPHVVILVNDRGQPFAESTRLARDVLLWSREGVAYRLEGAFTRDEALDLAQSLR